jgi:hypothetical protein
LVGLRFVAVVAASLALAGVAASATAPAQVFHGTVTDVVTRCGDQVVPRLPGTVGGLWNFSVSATGQPELEVVVTLDGKLVAFYTGLKLVAAADNNPPAFYHYTAASGISTYDLTFTVSSGAFSFTNVIHSPLGCFVHGNADRATIIGIADPPS